MKSLSPLGSRPRATRHARAAGTLTFGATILALGLAGCADPGSTTCLDYAGASYDEQYEISRDLLIRHRLEPDDISNVLGLQRNILDYCGSDGTRNPSGLLEDAVNWSADTW